MENKIFITVFVAFVAILVYAGIGCQIQIVEAENIRDCARYGATHPACDLVPGGFAIKAVGAGFQNTAD